MNKPNLVHRITCVVNHHMHTNILELFSSLGIDAVIMETGRSIRRRRRRQQRLFFRRPLQLIDSPINLYQFNVPPEVSKQIVTQIMAALQLDVPGRGAVFAQAIREHSQLTPDLKATPDYQAGNQHVLLADLALITIILSTRGAGEQLASSALKLGTGVPIATLGHGTGIRDRLGLLRITVPPEKELVHLLIPAQDAEGIIRLLIEEGRLNRPGKGYVYCTPVAHGRLDTSLQTGFQEHQASIEQIIAAIDGLRANTAWRRRFPDIDADATFRLQKNNTEITFICNEEYSADFIDVAVQAGASSATTARVQRMSLSEARGGAYRRCILTVPDKSVDAIIRALLDFSKKKHFSLAGLCAQPVSYSFSYR